MKAKTMTHTPTPWNYSTAMGSSSVYAGDPKIGTRISIANEVDEEANAEFIVRACNVHDELLDEVKKWREHVNNNIVTVEGDAMLVSLDVLIAKAEGK